MPKRHLLAIATCLLMGSAPIALAWENDVFSLRNRWENVTTNLDEARRGDALSALADEAGALAEAHPSTSEVLVWQGIILASLARETGGLNALGPAKQARRVLERAIELDPEGLHGSAYVTLGALYDRAPGWPVAFGDDDTAEQMFQRALEIRPSGIDVHYYYATYLADEGRDAQAREHARLALDGQVRDARQASDEALRRQAGAMLERLGE